MTGSNLASPVSATSQASLNFVVSSLILALVKVTWHESEGDV